MTEVFTQAFERGELTAKLDRIPAKETSDKEVLIDEVFKEIQEGPFDELRDVEIIDGKKMQCFEMIDAGMFTEKNFNVVSKAIANYCRGLNGFNADGINKYTVVLK